MGLLSSIEPLGERTGAAEGWGGFIRGGTNHILCQRISCRIRLWSSKVAVTTPCLHCLLFHGSVGVFKDWSHPKLSSTPDEVILRVVRRYAEEIRVKTPARGLGTRPLLERLLRGSMQSLRLFAHIIGIKHVSSRGTPSKLTLGSTM